MASEQQPTVDDDGNIKIVTVDVDEVGKELDEQISALEALIKGLKYEFGQELLEAQKGTGDPPAEIRLVLIEKLERQLHNDRMFREARALTRRP